MVLVQWASRVIGDDSPGAGAGLRHVSQAFGRFIVAGLHQDLAAAAGICLRVTNGTTSLARGRDNPGAADVAGGIPGCCSVT